MKRKTKFVYHTNTAEKKLYREQKEELCKLFNIVENGRRCGWKTIECMLEENGYTIVNGREPKGGKRYSIIMRCVF